jgi:trimethylamine monooxygenase
MFWLNNPKLIYIGMQDQYFTFTKFDAQAYLALEYILGNFKLPSKSDMQLDIDLWIKNEKCLVTSHDAIDFQKNYIADLCIHTKYFTPVEEMAKLLHFWYNYKKSHILTYRDIPYLSAVTGNMQGVGKKWCEAMDDTLETFVGNR